MLNPCWQAAQVPVASESISSLPPLCGGPMDVAAPKHLQRLKKKVRDLLHLPLQSVSDLLHHAMRGAKVLCANCAMVKAGATTFIYRIIMMYRKRISKMCVYIYIHYLLSLLELLSLLLLLLLLLFFIYLFY